MAIRYDKDLNRQIAQTVKNYNRRLKRLQAQGVGLDLEQVKVSSLKQSFSRRSDLLYALKSMESIRGTQEALDEVLRRDMTREKRMLTQEIKLRESEQGEPKYGLVLDERLNYLKGQRMALEKMSKFKYFTKKDRESIQKILEHHVHPNAEKNQRFYDNFFSMLLDSAYAFGYDEKKLEEIKEKLGKLTPDELIKAYNNKSSGGDFRMMVEAYHMYSNALDLYNGDPSEAITEFSYADVIDTLYEHLDDLVEHFHHTTRLKDIIK